MLQQWRRQLWCWVTGHQLHSYTMEERYTDKRGDSKLGTLYVMRCDHCERWFD